VARLMESCKTSLSHLDIVLLKDSRWYSQVPNGTLRAFSFFKSGV